ncbi:hypothetical protein ACBY01_00025 [Sphingomonas sp. ac-8]|uniref:hypothetical protein n=1 Tax=Sphingomonas sp. ac-8 TaxID=3242977 RepID=UPI003A80F6B9
MLPLIIDNFAGGGGASTGLEAAFGRPVDVAINHDEAAVAVHAANHPDTRHYCQSILSIDPLDATEGRPVALVWFSPDCKHHSKAKGGKPRDKNIRDLAHVVPHWIERLKKATPGGRGKPNSEAAHSRCRADRSSLWLLRRWHRRQVAAHLDLQ